MILFFFTPKEIPVQKYKRYIYVTRKVFKFPLISSSKQNIDQLFRISKVYFVLLFLIKLFILRFTGNSRKEYRQIIDTLYLPNGNILKNYSKISQPLIQLNTKHFFSLQESFILPFMKINSENSQVLY